MRASYHYHYHYHSHCLVVWTPPLCPLSDRRTGLQGKLLQKQLERESDLDPVNNTALDPVPDLLKALKLYPERAEPYMVQSPLSQADEHHCISHMLWMQTRSKEHALQLQLLP